MSVAFANLPNPSGATEAHAGEDLGEDSRDVGAYELEGAEVVEGSGAGCDTGEEGGWPSPPLLTTGEGKLKD